VLLQPLTQTKAASDATKASWRGTMINLLKNGRDLNLPARARETGVVRVASPRSTRDPTRDILKGRSFGRYEAMAPPGKIRKMRQRAGKCADNAAWSDRISCKGRADLAAESAWEDYVGARHVN
jgi:hypothetical protein